MNKPQRDMAALPDCWDEWDFISLQEVLAEDTDGDDSAGSDAVIWRNVGRGRHCVCIGPRYSGTYRAASAVHARWAARITPTTWAGRCASATVQVHDMRKVQIISAHLLGRMNCTDGEYHLAARQMASLVRGSRRHSVFLGVDANVHLGFRQHELGLIGGALSSTSSSSFAEMQAASTFASEVSNSGIRLLKTFVECWTSARATCYYSTPSGSFGTRHTWEGHIFGRLSIRSIDYLGSDFLTAKRVLHTFVGHMSVLLRPLFNPSRGIRCIRSGIRRAPSDGPVLRTQHRGMFPRPRMSAELGPCAATRLAETTRWPQTC